MHSCHARTQCTHRAHSFAKQAGYDCAYFVLVCCGSSRVSTTTSARIGQFHQPSLGHGNAGPVICHDRSGCAISSLRKSGLVLVLTHPLLSQPSHGHTVSTQWSHIGYICCNWATGLDCATGPFWSLYQPDLQIGQQSTC